MNQLYRILNILFHGFHLFVIAFTLFGWAFPRTRLANLILILATLFSWYVLGRWWGDGFCPVTYLHWRIRNKIPGKHTPDSYIKLCLDFISKSDLDSSKVNYLTLAAILIAGFISLILNLKDMI